MTCDRCGSRTTRNHLCRECAILDRDSHDTETYDCPDCGGPTSGEGVTCASCRSTATDGGAPNCGECGDPAPNGSYATQTPGLWLCSDCHPDGGDGRQPMEVGR